jgi:retinol dehydrogenase 12
MFPPKDMLTSNGYDLQFGTNVLGHWYLTQLLMPALLVAGTPEKKARVVDVSSVGAYASKAMNYQSLREGPARRKIYTWDLYAQSKLVSPVLLLGSYNTPVQLSIYTIQRGTYFSRES